MKSEAWKHSEKIEELYRMGWTVRALAKKYDVGENLIYTIIREQRRPKIEPELIMPPDEEPQRKVYVTPPKVTYDGRTYNDLTKWYLESNYYEPVIVKRI